MAEPSPELRAPSSQYDAFSTTSYYIYPLLGASVQGATSSSCEASTVTLRINAVNLAVNWGEKNPSAQMHLENELKM